MVRVKLEWRDVAIGDGPPIHTSLTAAETAELQRLAADADVLEVGSAYGYSTVALGLVARLVVAVDPHQWLNSFGVLMDNLATYGVTSRCVVEVKAGTSQTILPQLLGEGRRFDLVWIDGDHGAEMVEHDVRLGRQLLKPTGTLACHDYDEDTCPGVKVALDKLFGGPGTLTDTLAVYEGFGGLSAGRRHFLDCAMVTTHHLTCTCGTP